MSKKTNYTKEQKLMIKQCFVDCDIMGLTKDETIAYIRGRLGGITFSEGSYKKYRSYVLNEETTQWLNYYARQGFVDFYKKRIHEMEMIQKETFRSWLVENSRPENQKDKRLIISLVAELRANNQQLSSLGMATPIIATIKNLIDKNENNNANNKLEDANRRIYPIQYTPSGEDTDTSLRQTDDDKSNGDSISDMVPRDMDSDEEIC